MDFVFHLKFAYAWDAGKNLFKSFVNISVFYCAVFTLQDQCTLESTFARSFVAYPSSEGIYLLSPYVNIGYISLLTMQLSLFL